MKALIPLAAASLALALGASAAAAKPGDAAWSKCVWTSAPAAAGQWLTMPAPNWQTETTAPASLLGHKLIALCEPAAAAPLRPNRMPNWKGLASALLSAKPRAGAPAAPPATETVVLLCGSSVATEGRQALFLHEIVRRQDGRETISFRQYYADIEGKPVKLPQDLRTVVKEGTPVQRTCHIVGDRGELRDG